MTSVLDFHICEVSSFSKYVALKTEDDKWTAAPGATVNSPNSCIAAITSTLCEK